MYAPSSRENACVKSSLLRCARPRISNSQLTVLRWSELFALVFWGCRLRGAVRHHCPKTEVPRSSDSMHEVEKVTYRCTSPLPTGSFVPTFVFSTLIPEPQTVKIEAGLCNRGAAMLELLGFKWSRVTKHALFASLSL